MEHSEKRKYTILLAVLVVVLIAVNYSFIDGFLVRNFGGGEKVYVERVIDGDTISVSGFDANVRLLGINAPETTSKELYSKEAKDFLAKEIQNKNVTLEFSGERTDKYGRTLAYIFLDSENVNVKMVENGYAYYYFYNGVDNEKYSEELKNAWSSCLEKKVNLCAPSKELCGRCVKIYDSKNVINDCEISCDLNGWIIKGEGREKFYFNQTLGKNQKINFNIDLTNSGRSLYLRDDEGNLVDWGVF